MNESLKVIKNIESDFYSNNEKFNSFLELGSSYFIGNEYDKAIAIFEKAIELEPKNSGGWIGKAITHLASVGTVEINSVNISDYIEKAKLNSDKFKFQKYLEAITLHYGYQYAVAIKHYIEQTNQAISEKKKAQVAAVIGLATSVAGGAIANQSKSITGTFIGYSMLTGGAGVTIKKGYDTFSLDKLSKSLYGNALAQSILSVPTIQACHQILENSSGDLKQNTSDILNTWKDSVIYLFQNEKIHFLGLVEEMSNIDNLLDKSKRTEILSKIDEILYFMDMIGLDKSVDFNKVLRIKGIIESFSEDFNDEEIESIAKKRKNTKFWTLAIILAGLALIGHFDEKGMMPDSSFLIFSILIGFYLVYRYFRKKRNDLSEQTGLSGIQREISLVKAEMLVVKIENHEINLNLLGQ